MKLDFRTAAAIATLITVLGGCTETNTVCTSPELESMLEEETTRNTKSYKKGRIKVDRVYKGYENRFNNVAKIPDAPATTKASIEVKIYTGQTITLNCESKKPL